MKAIMHAHVDYNRHTMFKQSVDEVRKQLKKMLSDLEAGMHDNIDKVFMSMQRDYRSVLGGGGAQAHDLLPKSERSTRKEVLRIMQGAKTRFQKLTISEATEEEDEGQTPKEDNHHQDVSEKDQSLELNVHVKSEPGMDDRLMANGPESKDNPFIEAPLHEQRNEKPVSLREGSGQREILDALDAQLNGAQSNSDDDPDFRS